MSEPLLLSMILVPTPRGAYIAIENDRWITRSLVEYGEYSEGEPLLWAQLLKPGHTAFDVGANIGYHSVRMSHIVGPAGRVVAIEPFLGRICAANLALNTGIANVHYVALSDGAASIPFDLDIARSTNNWGAFEAAETGDFPVEAMTIDQLSEIYGPPNLIKIDVEGHELQVLHGGTNTLQAETGRPFLYFENDRAEKSEALLSYVMEQLNYRCYWHGVSLFRPDNLNQNQQNVFGNVWSINVIGIPEEVAITAEVPVLSPTDTWEQAYSRMATS